MRAPLAFPPVLLILVLLALGCSGPRSETGGSLAGTKGTSTGVPNGPVGLCMFDRQEGQVRRCLNFTFGRCNLFGDRCSEDELEAQRQAAGTSGGRAQK
jgi:hypothetical protein